MSKSEQKRICTQSECVVRDELRLVIEQLQKDKVHILDVMETMIPLTVCDKELKAQWKKLIKKSKHNSIGEDK